MKIRHILLVFLILGFLTSCIKEKLKLNAFSSKNWAHFIADLDNGDRVQFIITMEDLDIYFNSNVKQEYNETINENDTNDTITGSWSSILERDNSYNQEYAGVTFGDVLWEESLEFENWKEQFVLGPKSYRSENKNGVVVFFIEDGDFYSSQYGSGDQSDSYFNVTFIDKVDLRRYGDIRIEAEFSCMVYTENGEDSLKITNGKFKGQYLFVD